MPLLLFAKTVLCHDCVGWNSNGGVPAMQSYGGSGGMQHQVMDCAKAFVGS
jgi:hypothetical protein